MNNAELFDIRMKDGSRHFADLPETVFFDRMRDHLELLAGATETAFVTDRVTEMWLDFDYRDHQFSINNQMSSYWFFVNDPTCPQEILTAVRSHFALVNPR